MVARAGIGLAALMVVALVVYAVISIVIGAGELHRSCVIVAVTLRPALEFDTEDRALPDDRAAAARRRLGSHRFQCCERAQVRTRSARGDD